MIVPVVPPNSVETKRIVHRGRTSPRQRLYCARCITSGLEGARLIRVRFVGGRFLLGPRRGDRRASRGESQMLENRSRRLRRMDRRENPHRFMAIGTLQHVDGKYAAHQLPPAVVKSATGTHLPGSHLISIDDRRRPRRHALKPLISRKIAADRFSAHYGFRTRWTTNEVSRGHRILPIPFDQPCLVALLSVVGFTALA